MNHSPALSAPLRTYRRALVEKTFNEVRDLGAYTHGGDIKSVQLLLDLAETLAFRHAEAMPGHKNAVAFDLLQIIQDIQSDYLKPALKEADEHFDELERQMGEVG